MNEVNQILKDLPEDEKLYIILDAMTNMYNEFSKMIAVCKAIDEHDPIEYYENYMKDIMKFINNAHKKHDFVVLDVDETKTVALDYSDKTVEFDVTYKEIGILPYE